jgi:hypothetical protein
MMEWTHTASNYDDRGINTLTVAEVSAEDYPGIEHKLKFSTLSDLQVLSYFQSGKLIVEKYYQKNSTINYIYEFDNGVNISLKALSDLVIAADKAINEKKLAEAEKQLVSAKNTFPAELPENTHLAETWTKYKNALEKHNAELKKKEEEDRKKRESALDLSGMVFELYDKQDNKFGMTTIKFISNTEAHYIVDWDFGTDKYGRRQSGRDICVCKCKLDGSEIELFGYFSDRDTYPDPVDDSFKYYKDTGILEDTRYAYTNSSAPTSDLAWKHQIWHKK